MFARFILKNEFNRELFIRPTSVVWLHPLIGGGTLICGGKGVMQVEQDMNQSLDLLQPVHFVRFTVKADPKALDLRVAPRHVLNYAEAPRGTQGTELTLTRGSFTVLQSPKQVHGAIKEAQHA